MTEPSNEPPVITRPALRAFVRAAQSQPIVPTRLTAHEVQRAWAQEQREQQRTRKVLAMGVALGLAAAAMVALVTTSLLDDHDQDRAGQVAIESDTITPSQAVAPALDPAIRIRSDLAAAPRVLGPWSIALDGGIHEIAVQAVPDHALRIELPERTLELGHGELSIELVGRSAVVRLESGTAAWVDADGTRTPIQVERIELAGIDPSDATPSDDAAPTDAAPTNVEPSAAELARAAERELIAGRRDEATRLLRKLVRRYPRAPEAKTALMDLASQERLAGDPDRARCAYQLYLERWPHSQVGAEIDKQIAKLGPGPSCRGLEPR